MGTHVYNLTVARTREESLCLANGIDPDRRCECWDSLIRACEPGWARLPQFSEKTPILG